MTNLDSVFKSRDITWLTKVSIVKAMVFPVVMYRCASWAIKKTEYQRIDVFKLWFWRRLEIPLVCEEIKPKENQPSIFTERTEADVPIFWPPDAKVRLTGKDLDAMKDRIQGEKKTKEDNMVGWHHQLNGHEFEQAPRDGGQGAWHAAVHGVPKCWTQLSN